MCHQHATILPTVILKRTCLHISACCQLDRSAYTNLPTEADLFTQFCLLSSKTDLLAQFCLLSYTETEVADPTLLRSPNHSRPIPGQPFLVLNNLLAEPLNRWRGGNRVPEEKPLATSFRKCHILQPEDSSPKRDSNPRAVALVAG